MFQNPNTRGNSRILTVKSLGVRNTVEKRLYDRIASDSDDERKLRVAKSRAHRAKTKGQENHLIKIITFTQQPHLQLSTICFGKLDSPSYPHNDHPTTMLTVKF